MKRLPWVRRGQGWPREMTMGEERGKEARERARRKERKRSKHCPQRIIAFVETVE